MIDWLLEGDPVIQFQTKRDLLGEIDLSIKDKMLEEGWVKYYLEQQKPDGHFGQRFYQPKWTSTHYTLLDLCLFEAPVTSSILDVIHKVLEEERGLDGGVNPHNEIQYSDVCVNGMFLNYACYFGADEEKLEGVIDYVIDSIMPDGGFNCRINRSGAKHSSVHSTLSVLEGIERYKQCGYTYRLDELKKMQASSEEFLLQHRLFRSDKTGEIIHKNMLVFSYPPRWKYNILRAMDYFRWANRPYDERMQDALVYIKSKEKNGRWKVQAKHPGQQHIILEESRSNSRMLTLIAGRILKKYPVA